MAAYLGSPPTYSSDSAANAGTSTLCNTVVGATASDTNDVCGVFGSASFTATGGTGQTAPVGMAFANPLLATLTVGGDGLSGVPVSFSGPGTGASINPATVTAVTNSNGVASASVTANSTGGTYTVSTSIAGVSTTPSYSLTNVTNVTGSVSISQTGFAINRVTKIWSATMTVTNTSASAINGPIQVVFTNLTAGGVMMSNATGTWNGSPYLTVTTGTLAPGASVSVSIQFQNPNNDAIGFTPVAYSGAL